MTPLDPMTARILQEQVLLRERIRSRKECAYCSETVVFYGDGRGWRHEKGGGLYAQRCESCGYQEAKAPPATKCPNCGAVREWRDDHVATPIR